MKDLDLLNLFLFDSFLLEKDLCLLSLILVIICIIIRFYSIVQRFLHNNQGILQILPPTDSTAIQIQVSTSAWLAFKCQI